MLLSAGAGKSNLESSTLTIPTNASRAETESRSVGIGQTNKFLAIAGGVIGESRIVTYYFPIGLLVAILLGGPSGDGERYFQKPKAKGTIASAARWVLEGIVCGVLIVAAALAGTIIFAWPPTVLATELDAFLAAALAGFAGAPVFDKLMNRFANEGRSAGRLPDRSFRISAK